MPVCEENVEKSKDLQANSIPLLETGGGTRKNTHPLPHPSRPSHSSRKSVLVQLHPSLTKYRNLFCN